MAVVVKEGLVGKEGCGCRVEKYNEKITSPQNELEREKKKTKRPRGRHTHTFFSIERSSDLTLNNSFYLNNCYHVFVGRN